MHVALCMPARALRKLPDRPSGWRWFPENRLHPGKHSAGCKNQLRVRGPDQSETSAHDTRTDRSSKARSRLLVGSLSSLSASRRRGMDQPDFIAGPKRPYSLDCRK